MSIFDNRLDRMEVRQRTIPIGVIAQSAVLPILSDLKPGTIGATSLTNATVLTDTNSGTAFMAVVTNGGSATTDQIIAGAGGNIVAGAASSVTVAAGALQTVASITGLTTATTYQLLAVQRNGAGVQSLQLSKTFITA